MKSKGLLIVATLAIIASAGFYLMRYTSIFKPETAAADDMNAVFSEQSVGYIHRSDSLGVTTPPLQHISIQLSPNTTEKALTAALKVPVRSENLLVTVVAGQEGALEKVTDGQFDDVLQTLCGLLPKTNHIYLRWDPDMEVPVQRHSWQYQAPADYINAFRHVAKVCRNAMPSIQIMWSPAGYPGTEEYWPGADVIDAIGISVNGQSELAATAYPQEPDMQKLLRRKLIRTRFMNKPIWVVASGTDSTVQVLQNDLKAVMRDIKRDSVWLFQEFAISTPEGRNPGAAPLLGVYDPKLALTGSKDVTVEHLFVDLENIQSGAFEKDFNAVLQRGHEAIVTVEPWRDGKVRKDSSVLMNTIAGVYDEEFKSLFQTISKTERPVYVRFAHEMEIPIHRYPWQSQEPVLYIRAFRHFMELGSWVKNMKRVWGPAGDRGSMEWYPGGDVVDMVSIAIYGLPDKNITDPNKQESFETIFNRKIWRMRFASKPIFITEFGVKGPEDYQSGWMEKAAQVLATHREVVGACYFNLADNPAVWGDIPAPDWGISRKTFTHFAEVLKNAQ